MLDRVAIAALRPVMERSAGMLRRWGVRADAVTWTGFGFGSAAALAIANGGYLIGLALVLASRVCDGLDGALARLTQPTDRGAFLDITLDFIFYAAIPLAFAVASPADRGLPAATLLAAFIGTGSSFLAYAVFAERRGLRSDDHPHKGLYYLGGLTEASETLLCFALMCVLPQWFAEIAYGFAMLCALTIVTRLVTGWRALRE
jgi:phosphatidylglycerophosphate synthase